MVFNQWQNEFENRVICAIKQINIIILSTACQLQPVSSTLYQRCINTVSTVYQRWINSVPTLYQRCINGESTVNQQWINSASPGFCWIECDVDSQMEPHEPMLINTTLFIEYGYFLFSHSSSILLYIYTLQTFLTSLKYIWHFTCIHLYMWHVNAFKTSVLCYFNICSISVVLVV